MDVSSARGTRPTDLVIRPSGIRDTRAPFHFFFRDHVRHNRLYGLLTIGLEYLNEEAGPETSRNQLRKQFIRPLK